jgi:murein DD-endopeptidase MepM/ murein hydrolase activator NlpD
MNRFLMVLCLVYVGFFSSCSENKIANEMMAVNETEKEKEFFYGIEITNLEMDEEVVKKGDNLSVILNRYNVPISTIDNIVRNNSHVFDSRKIQIGKPYYVIYENDTTIKPLKFVYVPNMVEYYIFHLQDSIYIEKGVKEVETTLNYVEDTIFSSLSKSLADNNAPATIAVKLSEIYAWTIDFYRIQKGDFFRVVYEEKSVEGKSIGVGRILAAEFIHFGKPIYSFYFEQDSIGDYFDDEVNSLRKAFLKSPLKFSKISSRYNLNRFHPVQKRFKAHLGTDYAAPQGTPIFTIGHGVVVEAKFSQFNGNYVKIKHNGTYTTQYLHMSKIASGMKPGRRVTQGEVIGYVGSTGLATGPHVCFRFWKNGKQVDHLREDFPTAEPVESKNRVAFDIEKQRLLNLLNNQAKQRLALK